MIAEYFCPADLDHAVTLLAGRPCTILAGGTDLYPATKAQSLTGPVLDLAGIRELRGIDRKADGWRIGAGTTWTDVLRADLPTAFDGLKQAAREVGAVQIQNAGTVAGNLCNASPAADGVPPLLTLDASVELISTQGIRVLPLSEFLIGPRHTALGAGELVSAILVPATSGAGYSNFSKLGARRHLVISIVMVAGRFVMEGDRLTTARIAVGSCSATARRLVKLEETLVTTAGPPSTALVADCVAETLDPIDDVRGSAAYRVDAAVALVARMMAKAYQ